jgi:hypothetical protein
VFVMEERIESATGHLHKSDSMIAEDLHEFLSYSLQQEQHSIPHWQDRSEIPQQVGSDPYTQPSPVLNMQHEHMFHHPNHSMREPSTTHSQPVYGGGGMVHYETVPQQGMLHDVLPPQHHYHPMPPPLSPGSRHLPPPVMVSLQDTFGQ